MNRISKEYAFALFSLAREKHSEKAWEDALDDVLEQFRANPDYQVLLNAPNIPSAERESLLAAAFGGVPEEVLSFLQLLCTRGLMFAFEDCCAEYKKLTEAHLKISNVKVVSAAKLTREEADRLIQKLEKGSGRHVKAEFVVDPSLLGGMVVSVDGKIMDGSLRSRLRQVKEVISG